MSLIGNLEDLSLPDILQIISLSKKSGVLNILRGEEEGKIYIRQGKVILTTSAQHRRNIGDLLLERKLVSRAQLDVALEKQRSEGKRDLLGMVLVNMKILPVEELEKIIQEQIKETVFYFLTWREGTFKFDLREVDNRLEVGIDPQVLISERGIDTQWLVLEGTRLLDERRRKGGAREQEEGPAGPAPEGPEGRSLALVDDDDLFSEQFVKAGSALGLTVNRLAGEVEAREFLASFLGGDLVLVLDVVMPTADGRGFLGGVELARAVVAEHPEITLRMITAYPDDSVQEELRKLGVQPFLLKPDFSRGEGAPDAMAGFIGRILGTLEAAPTAAEAHPAAPPSAAMVTPGVAGGPAVPEARAAPAVEPAREVSQNEINEAVRRLESVLREFPGQRQMVEDLVQEIRNALSPSEIGLIVLRLSSELLERAILFKAGKGDALSLGGFGFEAGSIKNRDGLRNLALKLDQSAMLRAAVEGSATLESASAKMANDDMLAMVVGHPVPSSWIILAAPGPGETSILLYADSGTSGRAIQERMLLERFFTVAGLFMRKLSRAMAGTKASA